MAFNLNKNDETNSSTKFVLSKSNSSSLTDTEQKRGKSKSWLFAFLGLLLIGITIWYFLSKSKDSPTNPNSMASPVTDPNSANTRPANQTKDTAPPVKVNTLGNEKTESESTSSISTKGNNTNSKQGNNTSTIPAINIPVTHLNNRVPATFTKGSNSISTLDKSLVKDIISFLEKNPGLIINVNGYASSEGELVVNQKISQSRADAFKKYLVSKGIAANRINSTGKGIDNPISSNETEEGRIKNRRVEISFQ